jgi:hypothetical protein
MSSASRAQGVSFGIVDFRGVVRRLLVTARFPTDCRLWISPSSKRAFDQLKAEDDGNVSGVVPGI